jgi:multimeric flavodoxin WrbA
MEVVPLALEVRVEVVLSLSPHAGGTTEIVASALAQGRGGSLVLLRDYRIHPCSGCGRCAQAQCPWDDDAQDLFAAVQAAPSLVLVAPVYFYHLPAPAKAWVDRAQSLYWRGRPQEIRPAAAVLLAGRRQGEELFSGIVRTLRFFLPYLGFALGPVVELRGLESPDEVGPKVHEVVAGRLAAWP